VTDGILDRLVPNAHRMEMCRFDAKESLEGYRIAKGDQTAARMIREIAA
jgi:hypothetical protein